MLTQTAKPWELLDARQDRPEIATNPRLAKAMKAPTANPPSRSAPLGPKQLQWCRDNLGNFAAYEQQFLASKGETAEKQS